MLTVGATLPDATFGSPTADGPSQTTTADVFAGKKAVLFAVPGAFTPTCHQNHMPGFVKNLDALKAKGVDVVACVAVNDVFVAGEWAKASGAMGKITILADGAAEFTKAVGMDIDLSGFGMGVRSKRYAAIVEDRVVKAVMVEESPANADASSADAVLAAL